MKRIGVIVACLISGAASAASVSSAKVASDALATGDPRVESVQTNILLTQLLEQVAQLNKAQETSTPDVHRFCYSEGKAFSIGAKYKDQVCVKTGVQISAPGLKDTGDPLRWISAKMAAEGNY